MALEVREGGLLDVILADGESRDDDSKSKSYGPHAMDKEENDRLEELSQTLFDDDNENDDNQQQRRHYELLQNYAGVGTILKQIMPVLMLTTAGSVFAGFVFMGMSEQLELLPGLIVLIPAVMDTRGNIYGALGSRLATGLHLGIIMPKFERNPNLINISSVSIVNAAIVSVVIAILAYAVLIILSIETIPIWALMAISLLAGIISGVILLSVVIIAGFLGYRKGMDPDNLLGPAVTITGDIFSILALLLAAEMIIGVI
jgi:mgtE-like transporter